jgi:para-aminobenzoate synthetase/4-amino-4-deoxychorismate lyase
MNRWHSLPAELYAMVEHTPLTVLLECARAGASEPWTRLFTAPARVLVANQPTELARVFAEIESAVADGFFAAGFFSYECGACFEPKAGRRPSAASTQSGTPLAWFGVYERSYRFDHLDGAFAGGDPPGMAEFRAGGQSEDAGPAAKIEAAFGLSESEYRERIAAIHEWIRAGDVYQLNFTVPLRVETAAAPAVLYARLRNRQPVPYGAFLHWQPGSHILSLSPELFFRMDCQGENRRIVTRPMKGTAPRGRTSREDRDWSEWLRNDAKNRSENVMIVDLLRNDLGRLCRFGSVQVESLFAVERYPTLWQMTSTVTGELRTDAGFHEIFRALFPCGSITGAPKVRAMQQLAQLEAEPRGVYTGAIGFFSREQTVFNVAIRTLELQGLSGESALQRGVMGVGGGIVADSDAAAEFGECLLKAEFLTSPASRFPESFSLVETLLWLDGYPLIELHLDRMVDSAAYFDFYCDREAVKAALFADASTFPSQAAWKVRLLLESDGSLRIASERLSEPGINAAIQAAEKGLLSGQTHEMHSSVAKAIADSIGLTRGLKPPSPSAPDFSAACTTPVRVRIASERTDPRDRMLFHKTTHRPLYAAAFEAAAQAGLGDVIFLNLSGEVTEGAISNLFIEKDGQWLTPPIECGLLPGVFRRHLLETRPTVAERVLSLEDLRQADAVYLANAVRGLRRVAIDWESL